MKRLLLAITGLALLSGCQMFAPSAPRPKAVATVHAPTPTPLSGSQITAMETGVQAGLKNLKASAFKTSTFQAATSATGTTTACGYFRGTKGSGYEPFIGTFTGNLFVVSSVGDTAPAAATTMASCQNAGVALQPPVVTSPPPVKARAKPKTPPA
jgi:hypothetical protein